MVLITQKEQLETRCINPFNHIINNDMKKLITFIQKCGKIYYFH